MQQKLKSASLLVLLLSMMSACSSPSKPPVFVTDTFCSSYEVVCMSHTDSPATIEQVSTNEKKFKKLCPVEAAAGDRKCEMAKQ